MNWMYEKLKPHIGHNIVCVAYGDINSPVDICIECENCNEILISAEDFEEGDSIRMELKFFKKRGYDGTIRKVWTADKEVCFGLVGTVEDLLKEKVIEWCDYNDDIWVFIPYLGILQEANFGKTREEAVSKIK